MAPSLPCGASRVRVPPTSVALEATTVETLVSWGVLPSSLQEDVPRDGLVVLNGPRSLHLRSGVGVAEVLSLALERRDSKQLPSLRGFSHATNPAAFATNWRNLWPYIEVLGISIADNWCKALERGDADAVGRLVDVIAERQASYERNVLAYDSTPLPIFEGSSVAAARVSAAAPEQHLHSTRVDSFSRPSQQDAVPSTTDLPAAPARIKVKPSTLSAVKDDVAAVDGHGRLPGRSEGLRTPVSREPSQAASPALLLVSAREVQRHLTENQGQHSLPSLELTDLHYHRANTRMAFEGHAPGIVLGPGSPTGRDIPLAQLQSNAAQAIQRRAAETASAAASAEAAVVPPGCLKQAECQTDIGGPHVARSAGAQPLPPLLQYSQSNDVSKNTYTTAFPGHHSDDFPLYLLRQTSSLAPNAEGRCRDDAASLGPLAFNPVECLATAAPFRVESDPLLEKTLLPQGPPEDTPQQQERKGEVHTDEPESVKMTTHLREEGEVPLSGSPLKHRLMGGNESVAHFSETDRELANQEVGSGTCCPQAGLAKTQTELGKTFNATANEDQAPKRPMEHSGSDDEDDDPSRAEVLREAPLVPQITESSPGGAAPQSGTGIECMLDQRISLRQEREPTSRRRTSSIFKAAGGDWGLSHDGPFVASLLGQRPLQQEDRQQQRSAELLQAPDPNKRWAGEHQDCSDSWQYEDNIEELLLQSLKTQFGFNRRTSIRVVLQRGRLLEALSAEAGTHEFSQGIGGWIASLKESAAMAARRVEQFGCFASWLLLHIVTGAASLYRQGQLVHATALLEALNVLLLELIAAGETLQRRLLCHLRRSTAVSSVGQLAVSAAEDEAYVHSKAATETLAAIASLSFLWYRLESSELWSGGVLRKIIGCDVSYFLLARLLLQQQQRMQRQQQREGKAFTSLSPKLLKAITVEACTAEPNPELENEAALPSVFNDNPEAGQSVAFCVLKLSEDDPDKLGTA
ncbi:hypothetical protein ACSSS7_003654 [Eimeria intestinalis]